MLNKSPSSPESWVALIYCIKHLNITFIDYHFKKKNSFFSRNSLWRIMTFQNLSIMKYYFHFFATDGNSCLQRASEVGNSLSLPQSPHFIDKESIIWKSM